MILTLEASHTTITRPWDEKLQDFSTDPLKEEYDRITLYRDIPTFAEYVCAIADTELGILASSSPEEFTSSIKELIEGLATVFIRDGGAPISAVFCKEHWR